MATHEVNLDALIPRENIGAMDEGASGKPTEVIRLSDLNGPFYNLLRKPDFQRDTSNWKSRTIVELVRNFIDGELIPSIILWRSPANLVFVIDGSHRLSSLIAWITDDYGDGNHSALHFPRGIPKEQVRRAVATRTQINKEIGSYAHLYAVASKKAKPTTELQEQRANAMLLEAIDVRWVRGTPEKAEESFYRINGSAIAIDKVELEVIRARRKPNAIAVRAILSPSIKQITWDSYEPSVIDEIQAIAASIHDSFFTPDLDNPIKTLDLPLVGQPYSSEAFRAILDLVDIVCGLSPTKWLDEADDETGAGTISVLKSVAKVARQLSSTAYCGSLGLHPAVYSYSATGRFHPPSFLAATEFVMELDRRDQFYQFTHVRKQFEDFLVKHKHFMNALGRQLGSRRRPVEAIATLYGIVFQSLVNGVTDEKQLVKRIQQDSRLGKLDIEDNEEETVYGKAISKESASAAYLRKAIDSALLCNECGARLHKKSMTLDHMTPQRDGGLGDPENIAFTHPYCNSGYKERKNHITAR